MVTMFEKLENSAASASCKIVLVCRPLNSPGDLWNISTGYMHQQNSCVSFGDKTSSLHIKLGVIYTFPRKGLGKSMYGTV